MASLLRQFGPGSTNRNACIKHIPCVRHTRHFLKVRTSVTYLEGPLERGLDENYPGDVVVVGDVERGARLKADGDVIVWGRLEGHVHAGANGKPTAKVMALELKGAQLRIGDVGTLASAKVTVPGPHVASVLVAGSYRSLQLSAMNNRTQPDAAILASSKIRWLRYYPASSTAFYTGLYALVGGAALILKPLPVFGLLFDASAVPVGWIRVGGILLATFGLQYLGAAVLDWRRAANSRPKPSAVGSSKSSSTGGRSRGGPDADGSGPLIEAYTSYSMDDADATPAGADLAVVKLPLEWAGNTSTSSSSSQASTWDAPASPRPDEQAGTGRNVSGKTLSRGLDGTAKRQYADRVSRSSSNNSGALCEDRTLGAAVPRSADSTSSSGEGGIGAASRPASAGSVPGGLPPTATWAFSSDGFYAATIVSRLFLVAGFVWLVASHQVQPALLVLAGLNLLGAIKMWLALKQQHLYHVMGETPQQSMLGWLLEGAI